MADPVQRPRASFPGITALLRTKNTLDIQQEQDMTTRTAILTTLLDLGAMRQNQRRIIFRMLLVMLVMSRLAKPLPNIRLHTRPLAMNK